MKSTIWDIETGPARLKKRHELSDASRLSDESWKKIRGGDISMDEALASEAALSPVVGQILAIGIRRDGLTTVLGNESCDMIGERRILRDFWELVQEDFSSVSWDKWNHSPHEPRWVGFNTSGFDLPFVVTRSLMLDVLPKFPVHLLENNRFIHRMFLDLADRWNFGKKMGGPANNRLDTVAKALGIEGKNGSGAQFGALWSAPETRHIADDYLRNDIRITECVALRLAPEIHAA